MPSINLKRMRFISVIWGIIMCSLVIALTAYGFFYKSKTNEYKSLENILELKAQEYIENEAIIVDDKLKVSKQDLISKKIIEDLRMQEQSCEGYVIVNKNSNNLKYNAYIDCNKYKTKNYDKNI